MENQSIVTYKKSEVLEDLDIKIFRDNLLIVGIGTQPIIKLSNDELDGEMDFKWFLCGFGGNALPTDYGIYLKDNVILTDFPKWRITIDSNKESIKVYKDLFIDLLKSNKEELLKATKENSRVLIKEYFLIPSYMLTASHQDLNLDGYINKVKEDCKIKSSTKADIIIVK